jgi:hypothetical protein
VADMYWYFACLFVAVLLLHTSKFSLVWYFRRIHNIGRICNSIEGIVLAKYEIELTVLCLEIVVDIELNWRYCVGLCEIEMTVLCLEIVVDM